MKPRSGFVLRYATAMPVVVSLVLGGLAQAGTTWDGGGSSADWGDGGNWDDDLTPPTGTGVTLTFAGTTGLTSNNNYSAWDDFGSLVFDSGAGSFTVTGNAIDLHGKIENNSSNAQVISLADIGTGTMSGSYIEMNPVSGDLTINSGNIYLGNNQLRVWGDNGYTLTFGGSTVISGSGATFSLNQNSNVIFQSAHTYTGDTFINAGRLELASGASLATSQIQLGDTTGAANAELRLTQAAGGFTSDRGITVRSGSSGTKTISATNTAGTNTLSGAVVLNSGLTLNQSSTGTLTLSGAISGTGFGVTKTGTGTVELTNASNSFTGGTTITAGTLGFANGALGTTGTVTMNGGTLRWNGSNTQDISSRISLVAAAIATFDTNGNDVTLGSTLGGGAIAANLTKTGVGTLTISGANAYTGVTTVSQGTLKLGIASALGTSSLVGVASGGTLDLAGLALARPVEIAGTGVSGTAALYNSSTTAGASVSSLKLNADASVSNLAVTSAAPDWNKQLSVTNLTDLNGKTLTISSGVFGLGGARNLSSGDVVINSGGILAIQNGGSLTSVTGTITINSGGKLETRDLDNTAMTSTHTIALNGGTIGRATLQNNNGGGGGTILKNNITVDAVNGGTITSNPGAFGINYRLAGSLSGSGALTMNGSQGVEFQGDTSGYTGTATATAGTTTFNPTIATQTFNGVLDGARPVVKSGSNTTILTGANTYTGTTTVSAGTLSLTGANTGNSAFTVNAGSTLRLDYTSQDNSKLHDSSTLTLAGGTVDLAGTGSTTHTEIVSGTTLSGPVSVTRGSGTNVLRLNTITRSSGASINFGTASIAQVDNLNFGTTGILGGWATVGGNDWAVNSTNAGDGAVTGLGSYTLTSAAGNTPANYLNAHLSVDSSQTPAGAISANSLRFHAAAASTLTLQGANTLASGAIMVTSAVGANASAINGGLLQGPASGEIYVNQLNSSGSLTIGSMIQNNTGASSLAKGGTGTLVLTGSNTYTGTTAIGQGTLQIGGPGMLGSGTYAGNITNVGTLQYSSTQGQTFSGAISGAGSITKDNGAGTLTLSGNNSFSGAVTVSAGTVRLGHNNALGGTGTGTTVNSGAVLDLNGVASGEGVTLNGSGIGNTGAVINSSATGATLSGGVTLASATSIGGSGNMTLSGVVSGSNTLTKVGTGTLTLSGNSNTYNATTVSSGTLALNYVSQNNTKLNDGQALTIGSASVDLAGASGSHVEVVASTTLAGAANVTRSGANTAKLRLNAITSGTGNAINLGAASIADTDTSNNATTGILGAWATINNTDWAVSAASAADTNITAYAGGYYTTTTGGNTGANYANKHVTVDSSATLDAGITPYTLRFNAAAANTVTLTGTNTIQSGGILVTTGVGNNLSTLAGGNLQGTSGGQLLVNQSNTSNSLTISSVIQNNTTATAFTKVGAGTLTLTGANTYTGATYVSAGTLSIGSVANATFASAIGAAATGTGNLVINNATLQYTGSTAATNRGFTVAAGSTGTIDVSTSGQTLTISGGIANTTGSFVKTGAGNLTLSGSSSHTGMTSVTGGTLRLTGAVGNNAGWYVGSGARMEFSGTNIIVGGHGTAVADSKVITVDGGTFVINGGEARFGNVTLTNGGTFTADVSVGGYGWLLGNTGAGAATIRVFNTSGTSVATMNGTGGITMQGVQNFNVSDVTASTAADLNVNMVIGTQGSNGGAAGGLNKLGAGTMSLNAVNLFTGGITINAGVVRVGNAGQLASGNYAGDINNYGGFAYSSTASQTLSGVMSGTGSLTKDTGTASSLTLTGANTFTGVTTITDGTLQIGNGGATGSLAAAGSISVGAGATFAINRSNAVVQGTDFSSSAISGAGGLTQAGSGTTTLNVANSYTGKTTITAGILSIGADNNLGTAPVTATAGQLVINGGTLAVTTGFTMAANRGIAVGPSTGSGSGTIDVASSQTLTYGGIVANNGGSGQLIKAGLGTLVLNGSNTYGNGTAVNAGTLQAGHSNATNGRVTLNGGNLTITSGVTYNIDNGLTFASNTNATVSAASGTASIKGFDVNSADIVVNGGVSATIDSTVNIVSGGTFGHNFNLTGNLTFGGAITGTPIQMGQWNQSATPVGTDKFVLFKSGAGSLTLTGASTVTGNGGNASFSIERGDLVLSGGDDRLTTVSAVYLGGTANQSARLVLDGINQTLSGLQNAGTGAAAVVGNNATSSTLTVNNAQNYTFSGKIGGTGTNENNLVITKSGTGTLTVSGNNTYSGATNVNAGVLNIRHGSALGGTGSGTTVADGAALEMQGGISVGNEALGVSGTGVSNGGALRNISGNNTYGGQITLNANTRINSDAGTLTLDGSIIHGTGHNLTVGGSGDTVINGFITTTSGSLTKDGSGTLTLTQTNAFVGDTTISGGSLALSGSGSVASTNIINNGNFNVSTVTGGYTLGSTQTLTGNGTVTGAITIAGTLAIGASPGTMTFENDLGFDTGSISNFEINGFGLGEFDVAQAATVGTQTVTFGGTLNLLFVSGFSTSGSVKIFDFDSYAGNFTTVNTSGLASGYTASFDSTTGIVSVVPEASTTLLFGLGTLGLALRRRRAS